MEPKVKVEKVGIWVETEHCRILLNSKEAYALMKGLGYAISEYLQLIGKRFIGDDLEKKNGS